MKIIIAAICSLALSIAGILGVNELSSKNDDIIDQKYNIQNIEQSAEDTKAQETQAPENAAAVEKKEAEETLKKAEAATPSDENTVSGKSETNTNKEDASKAIAVQTSYKGKSSIAAAKKTDNKYNTSKNSAAQNTSSKNYAGSNNSGKNNVTANNLFKNGQTYVYKNVDVSNCDSYNDVVSSLKKNGYYNIDKKDLQKIGSIDDILALFEKNAGGSNQTPAPTTKPTNPAPTTKPSNPAPTTKPAQPTPTTKPAQPTPTTKPSENNGNTTLKNYTDKVLQLVNAERAKAGLSAFNTNSTLTAAANKRAQETVQSFSHTRPNGTKFSSVLQEYGISYRTAGENIAYGQRSPEEVVTGWMNSPGHRANILNGNFNKIGIGVYQSNGTLYWSQLFTN